MATATPAAIMGWKDRGALLPGMLADFVLFDENIRVSAVVINGKLEFGG